MPRSISPASRTPIGLLDTERRRRGLDRGETTGPGVNRRIANNARSRQRLGRDLFQQLQQFPAHAEFEREKPGGITAGPRQARNQPAADRIDCGHEHDRHGAARLLQSADRGAVDSLAALAEPLDRRVAEGRLQGIPGVGPAIADIITKIDEAGAIATNHAAVERPSVRSSAPYPWAA